MISKLVAVDELNAAAPLSALRAGPMPVGDFFVRSIFGVPDVDTDSWTVSISGAVQHPRSLSLEQLQALGDQTRLVTIECAGHGRRLMDPLPEGVPWGLGAASVAEFTGVPLRRVLELVDPSGDVVEFVFTGADRGTIEHVGELNYAFSLDAEVARADGPLLVWAMNNEPLPAEHGGPLRLLVPDHYGMASVKWLTHIDVVDEPYRGYFKERYRFFGHPEMPDGARVDRIRVRSLITDPQDGSNTGAHLDVRGLAWSGFGRIASVAIRVDAGDWLDVEIGRQAFAHDPIAWSRAMSLEPGEHAIAVRATDEAGNTPPIEAPWNKRGYANNAVHEIRVTVDR